MLIKLIGSFLSHRNPCESNKLVQDDIDSLIRWFSEWSLDLNFDKCEIMSFS